MKKVLLLLGPTGVGKTSASLLLAQRLGTEIISSDSMQIYRHMDIGTAKPSPDEQRLVRHHMIDIVEPWETYNTGRYIEEARPIIEKMLNEHRVPFIVGGTGLYLKAMTRGIFEGPSADWELRDELLEAEKTGPGSLYRKLAEVDPEAAAKIKPEDIRRTIRALEVCLSSGRMISEMQAEQTVSLPYDFIKIGLTRDRAELYGLINARVDGMFEAGLVEEVKQVMELIRKEERKRRSAEVKSSEFSSLQAIGYKELIRHFNGELSLDETVALIKQRSRNYAKRQFTWFRKEEGIQWIDITGIFEADRVCELILQSLSSFQTVDLGSR
jgi:tRNA dimethylallyltransferase